MLAAALFALTFSQVPKTYLLEEKQTLLRVGCVAPGVEVSAKPGLSIDKDALQTQMELALRRNKVPLCSKDGKGLGIPQMPQLAVLSLLVTALKTEGGHVVASWHLGVQQVLPQGSPPVVFLYPATTWSRGGVLFTRSLDSKLRDELAAALDVFCNDYLAVREETGLPEWPKATPNDTKR